MTTPTFFDIPMSFDPAASLLAVIAVCIAVIVFRATTMHRCRVVEFGSSFVRDIAGMSNRVEVVIRNTGLPIQNGSVHLAFVRHNEDGRMSNARVAMGKRLEGEFAYGALGRFEFNLEHPVPAKDEMVAKWLSCFVRQSPKETRPRIVICSGEFDVVSINLVSRFDWLLRVWNRVAFQINHWCDRHGTYADGQQWLKEGKVLPVLGLRAWFTLRSMGRSVSRQPSETERGQEDG